MTRQEKLSQLVAEHREFKSEMDAAHTLFPAIDELRRQLDAQIDHCTQMVSGLLQRYGRIADLIIDLTEGEEWLLGSDEPDESDTWWHEEGE